MALNQIQNHFPAKGKAKLNCFSDDWVANQTFEL